MFDFLKIRKLKSYNPDVREQAILDLVAANAVKPLIEALRDRECRKAAADALGRLDTAVDPMVKLASDPDAEIRSQAIRILGRIGNDRALEHLLSLLQNANTNLQYEIAGALGGIKNSRAVEALAALLKNPDTGVQYSARSALAESGLPGLEILLSHYGDGNYDCGSAISQIRDPNAVDFLVKLLDSKGYSKYAANALRGIKDPRTADALFKCYQRTGSDDAAIALGEFGDPRALEPLVITLKKENSLAAARCLREINDPRVMQPLCDWILLKKREANSAGTTIPGEISATEEVTATVVAVGKLGDPAAIETLIEVLQYCLKRLERLQTEMAKHPSWEKDSLKDKLTDLARETTRALERLQGR
ncbi:HEAT repeat domain-containing protein [bacterium]|nr:HEAT repeat domain-containing protein [bacterium]MCI0603620.1 HEAT repeat domain-containing protein [bacterium]